MTTDRFDQTARFTARFDPEGLLAWLLPGFAAQLRFERWLDTRTASGPDAPPRTADTVAELVSPGGSAPPWLLLVEFQTEPDPEMFGRLLGELGRFWLEHKPDDLPGSRYQLVAAVVNLTGTPQSLPASRSFDFPIQDLGLSLRVKEVFCAVEDAGATLDAIGRGETAAGLLAFIPLMKNGGEEGIIKRWLEVAATEPDRRRRGDLGQLALVMAELKPWFGGWQKALEGWNMRESTVIQGWIDLGKKEGIEKGIEKGRLEQAKGMLRALLGKRFEAVPPDVLRRIEAATDVGVLDRAAVQVLEVARPEDLPL